MTFEETILDRLDRIESLIKSTPTKGNTYSKWITEEEAMALTNLGKRSLQIKRKDGVFNWSTATGRKIKYLRRDVEKYLDNNSTLVS